MEINCDLNVFDVHWKIYDINMRELKQRVKFTFEVLRVQSANELWHLVKEQNFKTFPVTFLLL